MKGGMPRELPRLHRVLHLRWFHGNRLARLNQLLLVGDRMNRIDPEDIRMLALVKGEERYIFVFSDSTAAEMLRTLGRFASNPELSFGWYDAAVLSTKVREGAPA